MAAVAQRREEQLQALLAAAEARIAAAGLASVKMRDLAGDIGCALGALYNIVEDMDDLILRVRVRTLARLDAEIASLVEGQTCKTPEEAEAGMIALALAYCRFANANHNLWRTLFEHRTAPRSEAIAVAQAQQMQIFQHISLPLRVKWPGASESELFMLSRTLFAAVHGVTVISLDETLVDVPQQALERQIERLIRLVSAGLDARPPLSQS